MPISSLSFLFSFLFPFFTHVCTQSFSPILTNTNQIQNLRRNIWCIDREASATHSVDSPPLSSKTRVAATPSTSTTRLSRLTRLSSSQLSSRSLIVAFRLTPSTRYLRGKLRLSSHSAQHSRCHTRYVKTNPKIPTSA